MSSSPEAGREHEQGRKLTIPRPRFFAMLQDTLLSQGVPKETESPEAEVPRYLELPTIHFGRAIISDEAVDDSHADYIDGLPRKSSRLSLLRRHISIVSVRFPVIADGDRPNVRGSLYFAARPGDLRLDSPVKATYDRLSTGLNLNPLKAIFFSEIELLPTPGHEPPLAELGQRLLEAGQQAKQNTNT